MQMPNAMSTQKDDMNMDDARKREGTKEYYTQRGRTSRVFRSLRVPAPSLPWSLYSLTATNDMGAGRRVIQREMDDSGRHDKY